MNAKHTEHCGTVCHSSCWYSLGSYKERHDRLLEAAKEAAILFKHLDKSADDFLAVELTEAAIQSVEGGK